MTETLPAPAPLPDATGAPPDPRQARLHWLFRHSLHSPANQLLLHALLDWRRERQP